MKSIIEHLSLVTQIYGNHIAAEALSAQVLRDQHNRLNFNSAIEVLRSYGFENNLSKRNLVDIPSLAVPVVAILHNEEALVITHIEGKGKNRRYTIRQTDGLEQVLEHQQLEAVYLGFCWFIKPKVAADVRSELPEYKMSKAWFWKVIWRFRSYYYQVILATFVINFLALVSSLYVMNVYDRVIPNQTYETLWALSIGVFIAIFFEFVAKMVRSRLTDTAGKKADLIISSALFRRILSIRLIDKPASSGSYASNLREFEAVREFMTSASLLMLVDLPFLLLFVFVIFLIGGSLALVPLFIIPTVILVGVLLQPKIATSINESMKEASQRQGLVVEAIDGIETLKANNATNWVQQRWDSYTAKTANSQSKTKDWNNIIVYFSMAMQQLNTVLLVLVGTYLIHSENEASRITMGALIATVILSGRALSPVSQVAGLATRYQQARASLKGLDSIIERPIERDDDRKYITLERTHGKISFNNVIFKYSQEGQDVLAKLNLTVQPGERVGIIGRIGSGKSTLLKLASGLYEPSSGGVTFDDVDIRQIDPNFLRNQVALFGQAPRLFLGSLRENLNLARMDSFSSDQDLLVALRRFGLERLVQSHPRGLDMPLGENGLGLSGGQKQLVALARLTLRDPRVVLLDEPTSDLDQASENLTLQALAGWLKNRTLLVVTHRPQVLQLVQRVVVVDNGQVVMDGPRDAVLARLAEKNNPPPEAIAHNQAPPPQANEKKE